MKKTTLLACFALATSIMSTSCMNVGQQFPSSTSWIQNNKTTKADIEKKFGEPLRMGVDSGHDTYSYGYYRYSILSESETKDLTVRFNKDGTVYDYTFSSSFPDDKH